MKKNIYLIIITIITVVCIIAGSLYHIGGFALGLFDNLIPRSDKPLGNVCTEELSVDEFSNLVFDTTISNINVKTGDSYTVSYKCNKRLVPKIRSTGDTLTISQSKGANYKRNTTSEITVTIPEGTALNKQSRRRVKASTATDAWRRRRNTDCSCHYVTGWQPVIWLKVSIYG